MTDILELAGIPEDVKELVPTICETCRICPMWQRPQPKAKTHTRISTNFNEAVQMDLLFWNSLIILHIIDEATRFSWIELGPDKSEDTFLLALRRGW